MSTDAPKRPPIFLPAILTAALTYAAHFPVGLGFLGWVALVPLLTLVRHPGPRWRLYLAAYLSGLLFYGPMLRWLATTDNMMIFAWAFLAVYGSLYPVVGLWLLRRLDRGVGWPLVVTVPLVWTGLEFVKGNILTGFPWYLFAHTQHDFAWLIQVADLGGAWLVSFLVLAVNGLLAELGLALLGMSRWSRTALGLQAVAVAVLLGAALGYGSFRLGEDAIRPGPVVALVQSNVEQGYRNQGYGVKGAVRENIEKHLFELTDLAARSRPALIAWPETAIGGDFFHNSREVPFDGLAAAAREFLGSKPGQTDAQVLDELRTFFRDSNTIAVNSARRWKTSLLLGLNSRVPTETAIPRHNSAVYVGPNGLVPGIYHKIHCVPFGEYPPLPGTESLMPFPYPYRIHPGNEWPRFDLADGDGGATKFGVLICYEDTDPNIARPYGGGDGGPPVDFLVNISNDGWFANSAEHAEHLAICRLRAVEMRRAIVRSVNMGISAVVDSTGRVLKPTATPASGLDATLWEVGPDPAKWRALPVSEWKDFEVKAGVLVAPVPLDGRASLYVAWGDWLPWACWGVVGLALVAGWIWPVRR